MFYWIFYLLLVVKTEIHSFGDGGIGININPFRYFCERFKRLPDSTCAILFNEKNCQHWENDTFHSDGGFVVPDTRGKLFSLPDQWKDDVESVIVKKGCALQIFTENKCFFGDSRIIDATKKERDYLVYRDFLNNLEDAKFGNLSISFSKLLDNFDRVYFQKTVSNV